jgi:hypothetical protein
MSFITCRGLGGILSITDGYGAETATITGGAVISFENGGLTIDVVKFNEGVMLIFDDGDNYFNRYFELTAAQLAGTAWMLVKVSRSGSKLILSVDNSTPQEAALSVVKDYSGKVTIMQNKTGSIFDHRILKRYIDEKAVEYYLYDMT